MAALVEAPPAFPSPRAVKAIRQSTIVTAEQTMPLPDVKTYIPAGCLRINRENDYPSSEWASCNDWKFFAHPRDVFALEKTETFLPNLVQRNLMKHPALKSCWPLFTDALIRLEFKIRDANWGQVRVYIHPDDLAAHFYSHQTRSQKTTLLSQLDISKDAWEGVWDVRSRATPIVSFSSAAAGEKNSSLFHLFNNLPSPNPDPSVVKDSFAQEAMHDLLSNSVHGLSTRMYPYQQRTAAMMLQREINPIQVIDPRLQSLTDQSGNAWYCDVYDGTCRRETRIYEFAKGGICAETMGLGKTLICLALILATREQPSQIPAEYSVETHPVRHKVGSLLDMTASFISRSGTPWMKAFDYLGNEHLFEYSRCVEAIKKNPGYYYITPEPPRRTTRRPFVRPKRKIHLSRTTLIVVPPNLVRQWEHEIEKHTTNLKVLVMKDKSKKLPPALELLKFDIILFSRSRFEYESRDGSDALGRRSWSTNSFDVDDMYLSPLREIHFRRLITDEGHIMGNSSSNSKSQAVLVADFLQVTARWIVSGTPAPGLYGVDQNSPETQIEMLRDPEAQINFGSFGMDQIFRLQPEIERERKDLEKLGNIAMNYLKAAPWANRSGGDDVVPWTQYVLQPRHHINSRGTPEILRKTLESMIIRHQPIDVQKDIELPPLHERNVYLEGTLLDKISLNLFALMINSNAVTSERKDADYLFHPKQRAALGSLVANLRQASFFWSGFIEADVQVTIDIAKKYLNNPEIKVTDNDRALLAQALDIGTIALSTSIWRVASANHEMPMYVLNDCSTTVRKAWALDGEAENPTLLGGTQLRSFQNFAGPKLDEVIRSADLEEAGALAHKILQDSLLPAVNRSKGSAAKIKKKLEDASPSLAGGVKIGQDLSPRKKKMGRRSSLDKFFQSSSVQSIADAMQNESSESSASATRPNAAPKGDDMDLDDIPKTALSSSPVVDSGYSSPRQMLESMMLVSTASSKLSYLIDQVLKYQEDEKIIIFYENDNVAYYIAQALEVVNVQHLIYAKTLNAERRSQYIVTFNITSRFRCLLMDISQAAFGLDLSSASRVYFVNPPLSKQVEAQAVKRAHRIGQVRPVYVETLVLRSSIEEAIIERRNSMSKHEQKKCKTVLDDQTLYDWIKNVRFVPLPELHSGPEQMAALETPVAIFGHDTHHDTVHDPDSGLVIDGDPTYQALLKASPSRSASTSHFLNFDDAQTPPRKRARFDGPSQ